MAETTLERTYVIPLRSAWMKKVSYKRSRAAVQEIKKFIARHMKVADRDLDNVKLDVYLNNEMWFRGAKKPPVRVRVKARKDGSKVFVELAELPQSVVYAKEKHKRRHQKAKVEEQKRPEKKEKEITKDEKEKEASVAASNEKRAGQMARSEKHTSKKKTPKINRMALQK